jgi:HlyD family secretion protein
MNTDVEFQVGELDNALVVPTVAIVREASGTGVYVEQADGKAVFRPIETGVTVGNQTEVRYGIEEGEQILLTSSEGKGSKSQDSPAPGGLFPMPAPPPPPPG